MRTAFAATFLMAAAPWSGAWQAGIDYSLRNAPLVRSASHPDSLTSLDSSKSSGTYPSSGVAVREGGFSALWKDPSDATGHTFWSVTERGPVASWGSSGLGFPLPDYHQKLVRLRVQGDSLALISLDSIQWASGRWTTGLPTSLRAMEDTAFAMLPGGTAINTASKLAPDSGGYDLEGLSGNGDGTLWLSDEYGPSLLHLDIATRSVLKRYAPGSGLPLVFSHRRGNRGFEAVAVTPSGRVVAMLQSPMTNPDKLKKDSTRLVRILELDPGSGSTRQFAYLVDLKGGTRAAGDVRIPELVAVDDTTFLVLEAGETSGGVDRIDLQRFVISSRSTDISLAGTDDSAGETFAVGGKTRTLEQITGTNDTSALAGLGIVPVAKTTLVGDLLTSTPWTHPKPEGMALVDDSTVALINDNDYGANAKNDDGMLHRLSAERTRTRIQYLRFRSGATASIRSSHTVRSWQARATGSTLELRTDAAAGPWRLLRPDGSLAARIPATKSAATLRIPLPAGLTILSDADHALTVTRLP